MCFGLKEETIEKIISVFTRYPQITEVIIYGSRAKGNFKPGSDIDFTLKGENLTLQELNAVSLALENLFLPYVFDLSIYHHIDNLGLIDHIHRVGKVFYTNQELL